MDEIKIIVADDHKMIAGGIAAQLDGQDGISVLKTITDPAQICGQVGKLKPDAILMDIRMGEYNGIEVAGEIKQNYPETKVILMSGYNISHMAKDSRADAFTSKEESISSLIQTIRKVCIDHAVVFPNIASKEILTNMELKVLELISQDKRRKEIAEELFISEKTVTNHISSILEKLEVRSRIGAVMKGVELGLIDGK